MDEKCESLQNCSIIKGHVTIVCFVVLFARDSYDAGYLKHIAIYADVMGT
jgi:hypothetical protein